MPADLERDLGLYVVVTVSIGAMIGSGIFVLPGPAFKIAGPSVVLAYLLAGPSVVLAYLLAGLIVLPAALSKAELGTAMPEAGGTYIYIVGRAAHRLVYDVLFGTVPDRLVERLDCTVLLTRSGRARRHTLLRAIIDRFVF